MILCMIENNAQTTLDKVSLLCNRDAICARRRPIFIDFLGFRVYLGINRTLHASRKFVFQCAPGGSFFDQFTITSSTYALAGE